MEKRLLTPRVVFVASLILTGAFLRLVPHWPNFTPIAAMALFGGAYFSKKYMAYIIPLVAMFISDLIIGLHTTMIAVYIGFAITVSIGIMISNNKKALNIIGASVISTIIFFIITNFAAWISNPLYPQSFLGLMESYAAGLVFLNDGSQGVSFFLNSLVGDLFYNGVFFGAFYFASLKFPVLAKA